MVSTLRPAADALPDRRSELAGFLKARRAGVRPEEVGLPLGHRRRTPGLRREELAQLAGVGVTWYTWLEQGRPIHASTQVLDSVARVLRLDPTEHQHLYRLAGLAASAPRTERRPPVPEHVSEIVRRLDPMGAILVNDRYDVLELNRAWRSMTRRFHSVPCDHYNLLWCCFTEPEIRDRLEDWDTEAPRMVATFRSAYTENFDDPDWHEFVRTLSARSPEFARLWQRHDVSGPSWRTKVFLHPEAGRLSFTSSSMAVADMPGCRIIVYVPQDERTRAEMDRLVELDR